MILYFIIKIFVQLQDSDVEHNYYCARSYRYDALQYEIYENFHHTTLYDIRYSLLWSRCGMSHFLHILQHTKWLCRHSGLDAHLTTDVRSVERAEHKMYVAMTN